MNMAVKSVRIEAPIPGKALVGVEVPNSTRTTVTLKEVLQSDVMHKAKGPRARQSCATSRKCRTC